jgi:hypothetical protein
MAHDPPDHRDPDRDPSGLAAIFTRIAAVAIGLMGALIGGVLGAVVEGFRRAFGLEPDEDDEA